MAVLTELQNRDVKEVFIACVDGLTGLPEATLAVYPQTRAQVCMVHLVRNSALLCLLQTHEGGGDRSESRLSASTEAEAELNLELFAEKWEARSSLHQQGLAYPLGQGDPAVCLC